MKGNSLLFFVSAAIEVHLMTSDYFFSAMSVVGLFVSRIKQKTLNRSALSRTERRDGSWARKDPIKLGADLDH